MSPERKQGEENGQTAVIMSRSPAGGPLDLYCRTTGHRYQGKGLGLVPGLRVSLAQRVELGNPGEEARSVLERQESFDRQQRFSRPVRGKNFVIERGQRWHFR